MVQSQAQSESESQSQSNEMIRLQTRRGNRYGL